MNRPWYPRRFIDLVPHVKEAGSQTIAFSGFVAKIHSITDPRRDSLIVGPNPPVLKGGQGVISSAKQSSNLIRYFGEGQ